MAQGVVRAKQGTTSVETMAQFDIPGGEDFFNMDASATNAAQLAAASAPKQQFYLQKKGVKTSTGANRLDSKAFDHKLVERSLQLLVSYQQNY